MFESALSQANKNGDSAVDGNRNNNNNDSKEAEDDDIKNESVLKTENMTLQRKIVLLEQENMRLKSNQSQMNMPNTMDLGGLMGIDLTQNLGSSIGTSVSSNSNSRVRKERDPNMSLMNPRRAKRRKTGFKFAGSKKK